MIHYYCFPFYQEIPGGLPSVYEKALDQREKEIQSWQQTVKESGLSRTQRKQFQTLVESKFQVSLDCNIITVLSTFQYVYHHTNKMMA